MVLASNFILESKPWGSWTADVRHGAPSPKLSSQLLEKDQGWQSLHDAPQQKCYVVYVLRCNVWSCPRFMPNSRPKYTRHTTHVQHNRCLNWWQERMGGLF